MSATPTDPSVEDEGGLEESVVESTDTVGRDQGNPGVTRDDFFDILSNPRRRYALHFLKQRDRGVRLVDLAEEIAACENGVSLAELTAADRKRVYTALQQFHIPKMDSAGIVEFDSSRGVVTLTEAAASINIYLDVVAEDNISWSRYYLGLSAMSLAVITGVWHTSFTLLPEVAWAALIAAMFLISSLVHTYYNQEMRLGTAGAPPDLSER